MKRRLLIIAVFLLAGAGANVSVAWLLAMADPRDQSLYYFFDDGSKKWGLLHTTGLGMEEYALSFDYDGFLIGTSSTSFGRVDGRTSLGHRDVPGWARWRGAPGQNWGEWTVAFGWPFRCLLCGAMQPTQSPPLVTRWGGLALLPDSRYVFRGVVPLVPIWKGFAVNTVFYATILWLLIRGPFALRRFLRVRRGLCPKCAYPMGESAVCTECGKPLPTRVRVA